LRCVALRCNRSTRDPPSYNFAFASCPRFPLPSFASIYFAISPLPVQLTAKELLAPLVEQLHRDLGAAAAAGGTRLSKVCTFSSMSRTPYDGCVADRAGCRFRGAVTPRIASAQACKCAVMMYSLA